MRSTDSNIKGNLTRRNATSRETTPAPSRFRLPIVIAALGICLLSFNFQVSAGTLSHTFENKTGKDAYDLHIKYNRPAKVISQTPEVFDKVDDGAKEGKNVIDLSDGTVAAGSKVKVKAEASTGDLEINKWWWTDKNHKQLGDEHSGCSLSDGCSADTEMFDTASLSGVVTVEMKTEKGPVKLNLPADARPGDTISGLLEDERQGATGELSGDVIEINGKKHRLRNKILTFVVPPAGLIYAFILKNDAGSEIARGIAPPRSATLTAGSDVAPSHFTLPTMGQNGRPVKINGPYDGDATNTKCTVGGRPVDILAESTNASIFRAPKDFTGVHEVKIEERLVETKGMIRFIGADLSAPKTKLMNHEQVPVTLTVDVGENLSEPVHLQVQCTGSVDLSGGNFQTLVITPDDVRGERLYKKLFQAIAFAAGVFNIKVTLIPPNQVAQQAKCECKCEFAKPPLLPAGTRAATGGGTEYSFAPNVKISCNGNRCEVQKVEYAWTIGAASTATHSVHKDTDKVKKLVVDVTKDGTLELSVTVIVTCSDGTTCSQTGSKTFTLKK